VMPALGFGVLSPKQSWASPPYVAKIGAGRGMTFATFRRFWAVTANRNSSLAPFWATEAQSTEPEYALQMSEEHLDFFRSRHETA
jgi:hypothetical protein